MKHRVLLFTFCLLISTQSISQQISLTFTAEINEQYLALDSILVQNLTQAGDTMLYPPDSVLVLGNDITFINENRYPSEKGFTLSQNYPNPIMGKTSIDLLMSQHEDVVITVGDALGRVLIHKQLSLEVGNHSFSFTPGNQGVFLLTVSTTDKSETIRMITSDASSLTGLSQLEYLGNEKTTKKFSNGGQMKSIDDYDLGDQLSFTAFSAFGDMTLIDDPVEDITYVFDFALAGIPCPDSPTVTDVQGNVYNTVLIGSECWMKENLRTTAFNNEVLIPNYPDEAEWEELTTPGYVWYENDIGWAEDYGALYNGYVFTSTENVCPAGWHPSTYDDWLALFDEIGGTDDPFGNQLKSCRQVDSPLEGACNTAEHPRWNADPVDFGTDEYGFSAVPSGRRVFGGPGEGPDFDGIGVIAYWWTDLESGDNLQTYYLHNEFGFVAGTYNPKYIGISIRCVKD